MNKLFASVPPETNTTCDGWTFTSAGDLLARLVHRPARTGAEVVAAGGIAVLPLEERQHRLSTRSSSGVVALWSK